MFVLIIILCYINKCMGMYWHNKEISTYQCNISCISSCIYLKIHSVNITRQAAMISTLQKIKNINKLQYYVGYMTQNKFNMYAGVWKY